MSIITRHLAIRGRVQGVFYRAWTVQTAMALGITGWVRNRPDGSVEAQASGSSEAVEAFVSRCRSGPPSARVDELVVTEVPAEPTSGFEQRPTG
jgi:acylphosphatase